MPDRQDKGVTSSKPSSRDEPLEKAGNAEGESLKSLLAATYEFLSKTSRPGRESVQGDAIPIFFPSGIERIHVELTVGPKNSPIAGLTLTVEGKDAPAPGKASSTYIRSADPKRVDFQPNEDSENYAAPAPIAIEGAPRAAVGKAQTDELKLKLTDQPNLKDIAKVWDAACRDCAGGYPSTCCKGNKTYENNCAHFLSDALIRCGFVELLTDATLYKCDKADCQVPNQRRPIRAKEMWGWFKGKATKKLEKITWSSIPKNTGVYSVFQFKEGGYPGGHVLVLDTDTWQYYGTCAYFDWDQYLYQW
jgi:hypothetical protein